MSTTTAAPSGALITFPAIGAIRRRLYCLPFAGGGPATYRAWPRGLPSGTEVVVVVLPGRDPRSRRPGVTPPAAMAEIVPPLMRAIRELQAGSPVPFAVFGHSMGALVAYEIVAAIEATADIAPDHLFVSARRPPDDPHTGELMHALPDTEFLDRMQERYGGIPDVIRHEPDLLAMFLPALRADVELFETYVPLTGGPVRAPMRAYGGDRDRQPRPDALAGWQRFAAGRFSTRVFAGGHFYLDDARDELLEDVAATWFPGSAVAAGDTAPDGSSALP